MRRGGRPRFAAPMTATAVHNRRDAPIAVERGQPSRRLTSVNAGVLRLHDARPWSTWFPLPFGVLIRRLFHELAQKPGATCATCLIPTDRREQGGTAAGATIGSYPTSQFPLDLHGTLLIPVLMRRLRCLASRPDRTGGFDRCCSRLARGAS